MTAIAARISNHQLNVWRAELSNWKDASEFRSRVDNIVHSIPRRTFFQQAGLTFLRDAWIAGRVATALSTERVRLIPQERPDFETVRAGKVKQFEATEADINGRRRGDEPDDLSLVQDPVEKWRKRFEAIPAALERVIAKKLKKHYSADVGLVIYVNLGCYGAYLDEGLPILRDRTAPAKDKFRDVFAMWEGTLYKLWENGKFVTEQWHYAELDDF